MHKIRKILMLVLVLSLLLITAACKPKDKLQDSSQDSSSESESSSPGDDFWGTDSEGDDTSDVDGSQDIWSDLDSEDGDTSDTDTDSTGGDKSPGQSGGSSTPKPTSPVAPPITTDFKFPSLKFTTKTVKLMSVDKIQDEVVINKLKSQYGLTMDYVHVGWHELPLKLSASILSSDSPDAVIYRSDNPDLPSFAIKGLVQPVTDYANLNDPMHSYLQSLYKDTNWAGKNYVLISGMGRGSVIFYNTKLFKDYGVEDPWTLYKQGKWDWNKFAQVAAQFRDDTTGDGDQDRFGFVLHMPPSMLIYTTGESFGTFDGANQRITNNIKSPNIARTLNFLYDEIYTKKSGHPAIVTGGALFKNSMAAMIFGEAHDIGNSNIEFIAKKSQLGIVPLPRDPQANKQYYFTRVSGYFIPTGAKNPMGTVALNSVFLFRNQDKDTLEEDRAKMMERKLTDLHIEQLEENWNKGTPVLELTPFLGYDSVWLSFQERVPWATQVAKDEPKIAAILSEIYETEVEAPTGPKVVDNFEKHGTSTSTAIGQYVPGSGGSPNIKVFLDSNSPHQGKYNGRIDYETTGVYDWASVSKSLNSTWKTNNALTLWAKGDGKGEQKMVVQIRSSNNAPFNKEITLTNTGKVHVIPFSEFELADWWPDQGDKLNIEAMQEIGFLFDGKTSQKRSVYLDDIRAIDNK